MSDTPAPNDLPTSFGRFASLGDFLLHYRDTERRETAAALSHLSLERRAAYLAQPRNLADVQATLTTRESDDTDAQGGRHYHLIVRILSADHPDTRIQADVQDCIATQRPVFVAIRYGDRMGIQEPVEGLQEGAALHLKGEWITREQAQDHGGERMSVLHFTHHPIGFICTPVSCYS
ncbi:hypothetical protein [Deinococcus ruber]|uniref:Uncharacterized protein n=1 Tax=Deinococcus ruber TaxID=1848197 RepID=A0A918C1C8_9DEIO|nr:hypothetical protein [Deinococcus ruber]GGR02006.1 hypothetical protein GCM10008957_13620 [Deinococcus ruber]